MDTTYIVLDRDELLSQLATFMKLSYECTIAPQTVGGTTSRMGQIPTVLRESPANTAGHETVFLSGPEAEAYNDLRHHLSLLRETEWLKTEDLDSRLWTLACEIALQPTECADDTQRRARAEDFLLRVLRPLRQYQVIFTVEHLKPPTSEVVIGEARLTVGSTELLAPFVARVAPEAVESFRRPFLGKTVLIVEETGTAAGPVIERGRGLAHGRLHVLRSALAGHLQTHPDQLRFALGQDGFARTLSGAPEEQHAWARPPALPLDLELHAGHADRLHQLAAVYARLGSAHQSLRPVVERACEWIGRGLCRQWPGDALRDYTTAIEVLLIDVEESGQKSVLVPYRMLALADLHGESMIHPAAVRHAYDRRSVVVHEGEAAAGDPETTRQMLGAATDCIDWLVSFAADHPEENHASLLDALDTEPLRQKTREWLGQFSDEWSLRLVEGIRSLPRAGSKSGTGDKALVGAWREYQAELRRLSAQSPREYVDHEAHHLPVETTTNPWAFAFRYLVPDFVRELINTLNRWHYSIGALTAWELVLRRRDDEARTDLLWEFVEPLATSALTTPYRFKQNLIYATCRALDLLRPETAPLDDWAIKPRLLETLSQGRPTAERLVAELDQLDSGAFQAATNTFRHRFEHRGGLGVEIGIRPTVNRFIRHGEVGFGFGADPPLSLAVAIPQLKAEHARAVGVFNTFWVLVLEINADLRKSEALEGT